MAKGILTRFSLHYFAIFSVLAIVNPYLQLLLKVRGFSIDDAGILLGLSSLSGVAGPMVVGYLADRLGKRRTCLALCLLCVCLLALPLGKVGTFLSAATLVMTLGFFQRPTIALSDTLASHELPNPAHQYGRVRVWGSIGFVTTLLLAGGLRLVDETSADSIARALAVTAAGALASSLLLPDGHRASGASFSLRGVTQFDGLFWLLIFTTGVQQLAMSAHYSFFSTFLKDRFAFQYAGMAWAIGSAAEMPMIFFGGLLLRRVGVRWMLLLGCLAVSVRLTIYALVPVIEVILLTQLLHAIVFGFYHIAAIEFIRRRVPPERRGTAMAIYLAVGVGLFGWVGSSLGGKAIKALGYDDMYLIFALVPLLAVAALAVLGKGMNQPPPAADAKP